MAVVEAINKHRDVWVASALAVVALLLFYFSIKATQQHFDYTSRIASALLQGDLGLRQPAPSWLNEMVPANGRYYSVFPLGAILSMMPVAVLQKTKLIHDFPGRALAALIAALSIWFLFRLSVIGTQSLPKRLLLSLFPVFGTWTWCNLGFGGAWQIALGLALLGQTAALYFTLVRPSPLVAGTFFALAYGNRTELLITAPLYLYFFWQRSDRTSALWSRSMIKQELGKNGRMAIRFLSVPVCLAILTAAYNFARFHSIFDFGYTHIPEVHEEPWYEHGLFSIQAVPWNIYTMLFQGFASLSYFPYIEPNGFGCSIFLASPFLCLLFREGGKYKIAAWVAVAVLPLVLWCHGNPGSWQFSYRYAMILLPWMFLLLTGNGPPSLTVIEISLLTASVAINALAMWLFLWTDQIQGE